MPIEIGRECKLFFGVLNTIESNNADEIISEDGLITYHGKSWKRVGEYIHIKTFKNSKDEYIVRIVVEDI